MNGHNDLLSSGLDVLGYDLTLVIGMIPVEEGHLQYLVLVEEVVHGSQYDFHGDIIRIDEL